ncbi:L-dopachrome tautomerase-related protein [Aureimonas psammosilenae]|uniref:L-dopachrome tautomerase-related protein n=1 Tax=Aureimonas psammosilenae TaxID=2495496 RepID=UPI0012606E09|nr:L-dopachrome tautomerase-related protein [Aureimonas psammosilenae]
MRSLSSTRFGALLALVLLAPVPAATAQEAAKASLEKVADFPHQVTGVTVSEDNRIFVNFPRWTEDSPVSVAEVAKDGSIKAYPDDEWNAWRNARKDELAPQQHFVCVQSVVADKRGGLWVLDAAAPAQAILVPGGAKLVKIDLKTNKAVKTIAFDEIAAPQGSYLNDVRFSVDGRHAFITDSGAKGALLVVDLESGKTVRVLDGHPSTQVEKGLVVQADGKPLRRPDGRGVEFSADGIALSKDGAHLYWQAIKGSKLYRVPTKDLTERAMAGRDVADLVEPFGNNGVADGLLIGRESGDMYVSAPQEDAVKIRDLDAGPNAEPKILVKDARLRWPDTFSEGPDGVVYITSSHIQDSAFFKPDAPASLPTELWRINQGNAQPK